MTTLARSVLTAPFRAMTWRRTLYGLLGLPVAAVGFALLMTGVIASIPLMIVLLGTLVFLLSAAVAGRVAAFERGRARFLLRADIGEPHEHPRVEGRLLRRFGARVGSWRTWREILFVVFNLPVSFVVFFLCVYPWIQVAYSISYPIVFWGAEFGPDSWGGPSWLGVIAVHSLPGYVLLFATPWIVWGATWLQVRWIQLMTGSPRNRSLGASSGT